VLRKASEVVSEKIPEAHLYKNLAVFVNGDYSWVMATYHLNASVLSRGRGTGSAVAAAAYRHNSKMKSEYNGDTYNYETKGDLVHAEITLPQDAPEWAEEAYGLSADVGVLGEGVDPTKAGFEAVAKASSAMWNDIEVHEARTNKHHARAQLARKFTLALPLELSLEQQIELSRTFIQDSFASRGMVADWVLHDPRVKEQQNPHVHIMVGMRELDGEGWGSKNRDWNARGLITAWRFEWASATNIALERAGFDVRVDHRSFEDQGIELKPDTFNENIAGNAEQNGEVARNKLRASEARAYNEAYLKEHPEHILTVLGARQTVFTSADVRGALMERMSVGVEELDALFASVMGSHELVLMEATAPDGAALYSTRARATLENNLIVDAMAMAASRLNVYSFTGLKHLSDSLLETQRDAAEAMLSDARLTMVTGVAGTGKTYTLHEVAKVWKRRGYEVIGGATSGKATQEMSGIVGMEAASLAAWEARWARGRRPAKKFVFIMDEAGMTGSDVWARVQGQVSAMGGKLIVVGDPEQLQPVNETSAFKAIQERIGVTVMDQVKRQDNRFQREATRAFALGGEQAQRAIRYYHNNKNVQFTPGVEDAVTGIVERYFETAATPENRIAVALSNKDVWALNAALRTEALVRGAVVEESVTQFGNIVRLERLEDGSSRRKTVPLMVGTGDRLLFTKAHRALGVPKSSMGTVVAVRSALGEIDIQIDGMARVATVDMNSFNHFDYAFASTIHKTQGMTVDHAYVLGHGFMNQHHVYVAMSRHRQSVEMFVPQDRIEDMSKLEEIVQKKGYLNFAVGDNPELIHERSGMGVEASAVAGRSDYTPQQVAFSSISFEGDAHLAGVVGRVSGLLASEYVDGDPFFGEDPRGYSAAPTRIVDDIIEKRSTFSAADVANQLSSVVKEPETFVRLFKEAMQHPDIVVLRDEIGAGVARVYSTTSQVALELDVVDRGARLALMDNRSGVSGEGARVTPCVQQRAGKDFNLNTEQRAALEAASNARFSITSGGSGSGKSRLAAAIGAVHEEMDWSVVRIAPTGVGADNLRNEGGASPVMTFAALEYAVAKGYRTLDQNTVIIMDEAGQVGAASADRLFGLVEQSGAKLVALRDTDQFGPYEAAPIFQALEVRIGGSTLEQRHRSRNFEVGAAVEQIAQAGAEYGAVAQGLNDAGVLHAGGSRPASIDQLAQDFVQDPNTDKRALTHSRADVAALNDAIRAKLDVANPARLEGRGDEQAVAGSIADLRIGDRIVLSEHYQMEGTRLRAGTALEVERRDEAGVVLRMGAGEEAQYLKLTNGASDFDYRFGFATTVHGSKGRTIDSVHMLATPGMSRGVFNTGTSLHRTELNVVLPTTPDNVERATRAILQTDDTARSVLDYGFEATQHARQVAGTDAGAELREPSKVVDGFNRVVDWVADRLDGGAGAGSEVAKPTRATLLRASVVAELIAVRGGNADEQAITATERQSLERGVDALINRRAWGRLLGQLGREDAGERTGVETPASMSGQDRMVTRILERGALAAGKAQDDGMRDWFGAAINAVQERQEGHDMKFDKTVSVEQQAKEAALANLARAFTSAVSRHVDFKNPVHDVEDLNGAIKGLLERSRAADLGEHSMHVESLASEIAMNRRIVEIKLDLIEEVRTSGYDIEAAVYEDKNPFGLFSPADQRAYAEKLPELIEQMKQEGVTPSQADTQAARMQVYAANHEPNAVSVAAAVVEGSGFEKVEDVKGAAFEAVREAVLNDLILEGHEQSDNHSEKAKDLLTRVYRSFTRKEIASLFDPESEQSKTLPINAANRVGVQKGMDSLKGVNLLAGIPRHNHMNIATLNKPGMAQSMGYGR